MDASAPLLGDTAPAKAHEGGGGWRREVLSLLKWSMLAACTVGPGTVVVCAKSGADFDLRLLWVVIVAAFVAFVLQKEAARLTMESGMSLGCAVRLHFGRAASKAAHEAKGAGDPSVDPGLCNAERVPLAGYTAVLGVFIGNTAYEANCFVGAMAALYVLYQNTLWFRVVMSVTTGVATLAALLWGDVDQIGAALGVIVLGMCGVFAVTAGFVPVDAAEFGSGLLPNFPAGSSVTVLSLMATTCIPFNVFLAASMCENTTGGEMRRGVMFASVVTAVLSVLVIVIGSNIDIPIEADFRVEDLGREIGENLGEEAKTLFCIGLYAAAYSSAITCPLGAALTAEQILYEDRAARPASASESGDGGAMGSEEYAQAVAAMRPPLAPLSVAWLQWWARGRLFFVGSMSFAVALSVVVAAANADTVSVILLAQVINGLLLPFVAICLFRCLNDPGIMPRTPRVRDNALVLVCVSITIFLAAHLVLEQVSVMAGGGVETEDINEEGEASWKDDINMYAAAGVTVLGAIALALRKHAQWGSSGIAG